jgi:predicted DsbA family dithiol-disulfide isomerase
LSACAKSDTSSQALSAEQKTEKRLKEYVKGAISVNPNFSLKEIRIREKQSVDRLPGWFVYFLDIDLLMADKKDGEPLTVYDKIFTNGEYIVKDFYHIVNKASLKSKIAPEMDVSFYNKEHLIYGNFNAPNKIVAFSDPVCPFCQGYMPGLLKAAKAHPDKIALFYYHFPLTMLHKEAPTLIKAALVAEKQGIKDVMLKLYEAKISLDTDDEKKILKLFNKTFNTSITVNDIKNEDILIHYSNDIEEAGKMMINGTPTIYVNGRKDFGRSKYKELIK